MRSTTPSRTLLLLIGMVSLFALPPRDVRANPDDDDDDPQVVVRVGRNSIFVGESLEYTVHLNNMLENYDRSSLVLPKSDDYELRKVSEQQKSFQGMSIINGKIQRYGERGWVIRYTLTPLKSGTLDIAAPTVKYKGQTLTGNGVRITVKDPDSQDIVLVESSITPPTVYPLQRFTVAVRVFVRALPKPYEDKDPVEANEKDPPPRLGGGWLEASKPPKNIFSEQKYTSRRSAYQDNGGTRFRIPNPAPQNSGFSPFYTEYDAYVRLPVEKVERKDKKGMTATFWQYTFERSFYATEPGTYTMGAIQLRGTFFKGGDDEIQEEQIYALTKPVSLAVKSPPSANRPANYTGAIGTFTLGAMMQPSEARVGDPLKLTLTLRGTGLFDAAKAPDLSQVPGFSERFKSYDVSSETIGNVRRFTYGIRPIKAGEEPFPEIAYSYFDPQKEEYVTTTSEPIPLSIAEGAKFDDSQIVGASQKPAAQDAARTTQPGIFANISDSSLFRNESTNLTTSYLWLSGLVAAILLQFAAIAFKNRRPPDPLIRQRKQSPTVARNNLRSALEHFRAERLAPFADQFRLAFAQPVADAANVPVEGLTPRDIEQHMLELGVSPELIKHVAASLSQCEQARYGASNAELNSVVEGSQPLLDQLIAALKKLGKIG